MIVEESIIRNISNEEKQLIYDALVHYMFFESDMGKSNHFAADTFKEDADKYSKMGIQLREAWTELIP